ncbi:hypothetical protein ABLI39_13440, partial [Pseudarthrobacter sp. B907]|uniref:hypothetical protein n=1 Tax=Pseudarthrobacter sp. B907 TaxID=3158261 RepID=UPI0032DAE015
MRVSHSSKTYQLAAAKVANSACFRPFLGKFPGFEGLGRRFSAISGSCNTPVGAGRGDRPTAAPALGGFVVKGGEPPT